MAMDLNGKTEKVNQSMCTAKLHPDCQKKNEKLLTSDEKRKAICKVTTLDTSDTERIKRACKKILCL
jgi:hypothetical protein